MERELAKEDIIAENGLTLVKQDVKQSELKEYGYPHYIFNKDWNGYLQFDPEAKEYSDFIIGHKISYSDEKPVFEETVEEVTELSLDSFAKYYLEIVDLRKLTDSYEVYSQEV